MTNISYAQTIGEGREGTAATEVTSEDNAVTVRSEFATTAIKFGSPDRRVVLRKLNGILLKFEGKNATVLMFIGNDRIEYNLPAEIFREAGVTEESQPFEYIEGKRTSPQNEVERFTKIIPLAPAESAKLEPIELDSERRSKLERILRRLNIE